MIRALFSAAPLGAGTLTVTNTNDSETGSLRQAIADAAASGDTINITATGTITLTSSELVIDKNVTISGPGVSSLAISGNNSSRVFNIGSVTVAISGLTIENGNASYVGGGIYNAVGTFTAKNSIVANNLANSPSVGNCGLAYQSITFSQGHNLSSDSSCASFFIGFGDLNDINPLLDPEGLKDNGGPTQTIALLEGSPAVDAIPVSDCTDVNLVAVTTDQRGVTRPQPQGGNCDIGAFELAQQQTPAEAITTLTNQVHTLELNKGIDQSLSAMLRALASVNQGDQLAKLAAINQLQAFIYQVSALQGVKLTPAEAASLIQAAQQIMQSLSSSP